MTKRRLTALLISAVAIPVGVGGLIYSRTRGPTPDATGAKVDDTQPPVQTTKATAPARKLNEKEQMLVGTWKFEKVTPPLFSGGGYRATYRFTPDGTSTFSFSNDTVKNWSQSGKFRIAIDVIIIELESGRKLVNAIEQLDGDRFIESHQDGRDRMVVEWSRVRDN